MKKYNYTLIISQYYHSRHFFLVKFTKDFIQQSMKFIAELEKYKRFDEYKKDTARLVEKYFKIV